MAKKRNYRKFDEVNEEYYRAHPEEIDNYLQTAFEEYASDGHTSTLLSSLRMVARVKGVSLLAEESNLSRNGIQKALSEQAKPRFDTINAIVHAMGYGITLQRLD
ncbi:MAG: addiction module antidote protein [Pseudomonadota bacterium]